MAENKPRISHDPKTERLEIHTPIDAEKAEAIKRCVEKGHLRMTFSSVDLRAGRVGEAWEYD